MKGEQVESRESSTGDAEDNQLRVGDIVQYLLGLARLHEKGRANNTELSEGLRIVAHALRPYADCLVLELTDIITEKRAFANKRRVSTTKVESKLPDGLESIAHEDIELMLNSESYTKREIAELGLRRFGISRSKLERLRKKDARDAVRAALEHEKSLDAISIEARKGGKARSA